MMAYVPKIKGVESFILDSELVPIDRSKKSVILPFSAITQRKRKNVILSEIKNKVCITAFDILFLNGKSLL
jgi:DNA ligase 1